MPLRLHALLPTLGGRVRSSCLKFPLGGSVGSFRLKASVGRFRLKFPLDASVARYAPRCAADRRDASHPHPSVQRRTNLEPAAQLGLARVELLDVRALHAADLRLELTLAALLQRHGCGRAAAINNNNNNNNARPAQSALGVSGPGWIDRQGRARRGKARQPLHCAATSAAGAQRGAVRRGAAQRRNVERRLVGPRVPRCTSRAR